MENQKRGPPPPMKLVTELSRRSDPFSSGFFPGGRPLNVVTQQRNERHGNYQSTEQCCSHDDGEAFEKLSGVAAEHEERKIGNDVGQGCVKDGSSQLGRTQPRSYSA